MTSDELKALRSSLGLTQAEMARRIGLAISAYQDIETGVRSPRDGHALAAERAALAIAVERREPMLAPANVRREALELARLLTG